MNIFLEIGACDFDTCAEWQTWAGHIYEPSPYFARRLRNMTRNRVIEKAVGGKSGLLDYYGHIEDCVVSEEWQRGVGGFTHEVNGVKYGQKARDSLGCSSIKMEVITLNEAMETLVKDIGTPDLLKMDTEGMDLNILKSYDWYVKPLIIKCENGKCREPDVITEEMIFIIEKAGYKVWNEEYDIYAIRK